MKKIISDQLGADNLRFSQNLFKFGAGSIGIIKIAIYLEEEIGILISDQKELINKVNELLRR